MSEASVEVLHELSAGGLESNVGYVCGLVADALAWKQTACGVGALQPLPHDGLVPLARAIQLEWCPSSVRAREADIARGSLWFRADKCSRFYEVYQRYFSVKQNMKA